MNNAKCSGLEAIFRRFSNERRRNCEQDRLEEVELFTKEKWSAEFHH
jgi:hypothetical protein